MGKHLNNQSKKETNSNKKIKFKFLYFILIFFLIIVLTLGAYFIYINVLEKDNTLDTNSSGVSTSNIKNIHSFENADYLSSKDLSIDVENGISKISGTIINSSNDTIRKITCIYSLLDSSNNVVYELKISISKINGNDSSSFSSISSIDLSNVVNYSIKLAEQ